MNWQPFQLKPMKKNAIYLIFTPGIIVFAAGCGKGKVRMHFYLTNPVSGSYSAYKYHCWHYKKEQDQYKYTV